MGFLDKLGKAYAKANDVAEKMMPIMQEKMDEYYEKADRQREIATQTAKRQLAEKTDQQIIKISNNPNLSGFQKEMIDEEMKERGLM